MARSKRKTKRYGSVTRTERMKRNAGKLRQRVRKMTVHIGVTREIRSDRGGNGYYACASIAKSGGRGARRTECQVHSTPSHAIAGALRRLASNIED